MHRAVVNPHRLVTQARLKEVLHYDPESGIFHWLVSMGKAKSGSVAGSIRKRGYRSITIDKHRHLAHRLAWFYVTGAWPDDEIDHWDMSPDNNRFANLRPCTSAQNKQNQKLHARNTSGFTGVSWSKVKQRWIAQISADQKTIYIGHYGAAEDASEAYKQAKARLHTFQPTVRE